MYLGFFILLGRPQLLASSGWSRLTFDAVIIYHLAIYTVGVLEILKQTWQHVHYVNKQSSHENPQNKNQT